MSAKRGMAEQIRWLYGWMGPSSKATVALGLLLAIVLATLSWGLPGIVEVERGLFMLRYTAFIERADADPRVVQVGFTDETVLSTGRRSPLDRGALARALAEIDKAGPRAIGIDIVIDTPQPENAALLEVLRRVKTPTYLADAQAIGTPDETEREAMRFVRGFVAAAQNPNVRLASVRLQTDSDGVIRRWPAPGEGLKPLLAVAMAGKSGTFRGYEGPIRYRLSASRDEPLFAFLPIDLYLNDAIMGDPSLRVSFDEMVRGKHVLLGANLTDIDQFEMPFGDPATGRDFTSGLDIHAHMLAQALDDVRYRPTPGWLLALLTALVIPLGLGTGLAFRSAWAWWGLVTAQVVALLVIPFVLQAIVPYPTYGFPAIGLLLSWALAFALVLILKRGIAWEQGKVAQLALTRYLPPDVAGQILNSPSKDYLSGDRRSIFTLFTDLEGFTALCQRLDPAVVADLLNDYLERLSRVVIEQGGTIDKYVGDAVVAIWGAPIAKSDDGVRAYRAALAMYAEGEAFRSDARWSAHGIGRTRVGLHYGEAIVGNFGGQDRVHYTALGDTINVAARLEGANKELATKVLISGEVLEQIGEARCRPMGSIVLRGRDAPIIVFEPAEHMTDEELAAFADVYRRYLAGEAAALSEMTKLAADREDDEALSRFVARMSEVLHPSSGPAR